MIGLLILIICFLISWFLLLVFSLKLMHIDVIAICRSTLYNLRKSKVITNELILDTNASEYDSIQKLVYHLWLFSGLFMLIAGILFGLMFK